MTSNATGSLRRSEDMSEIPSSTLVSMVAESPRSSVRVASSTPSVLARASSTTLARLRSGRGLTITLMSPPLGSSKLSGTGSGSPARISPPLTGMPGRDPVPESPLRASIASSRAVTSSLSFRISLRISFERSLATRVPMLTARTDPQTGNLKSLPLATRHYRREAGGPSSPVSYRASIALKSRARYPVPGQGEDPREHLRSSGRRAAAPG